MIVPYGTDVTALTASFNSTGQSVTVNGIVQTSGLTSNNFTNPVVYTVIAEDGSTITYTVLVNVALNSAKEITDFHIDICKGIIDQNTNTINVDVWWIFGLSNIPSYFTTTGVEVTVNGYPQYLNGGTINNFDYPNYFVVHAADGSTKTYTIYARSTDTCDT